MKKSVATIIAILSLSYAAGAQHNDQPYAGFQNRPISSLSAEDIETLQTGGG